MPFFLLAKNKNFSWSFRRFCFYLEISSLARKSEKLFDLSLWRGNNVKKISIFFVTLKPQKPLKLDFIKNPNVRKYESYCMITISLFSDDPAPTGGGKDGGGGDAEFCRRGHGA